MLPFRCFFRGNINTKDLLEANNTSHAHFDPDMNLLLGTRPFYREYVAVSSGVYTEIFTGRCPPRSPDRLIELSFSNKWKDPLKYPIQNGADELRRNC